MDRTHARDLDATLMNKVLVFAQFHCDYERYLNEVENASARHPGYAFVSVDNYHKYLRGRWGGRVVELQWRVEPTFAEWDRYFEVIATIKSRGMEVAYHEWSERVWRT